MSEAGLDAAADSLRTWLNQQQFTDLRGGGVTKFFTESITTWAFQLGYTVSREFQLPQNDQRPDRHPGRIELRARHNSGRGRAISIEIDKTTKLWSLDKLTQAVRLHGDLAIRLRWSRAPIDIEVPPTVRLIRAQVTARPVPNARPLFSLQLGNCGGTVANLTPGQR